MIKDAIFTHGTPTGITATLVWLLTLIFDNMNVKCYRSDNALKEPRNRFRLLLVNGCSTDELMVMLCLGYVRYLLSKILQIKTLTQKMKVIDPTIQPIKYDGLTVGYKTFVFFVANLTLAMEYDNLKLHQH